LPRTSDDSRTETLERLRDALDMPDRVRGVLEVCRVITELLAPTDGPPILVGGAAVELYTGGTYRTEDYDFVAPTTDTACRALEDFGFERRGRNFVLDDPELWIELPSSSLDPDDDFREIDYEGTRLRILSQEALLADRLRAFVHWRSLVDGINAFRLLQGSADLDRGRVEGLLERDPLAERALRRVRALVSGGVSPEALEGQLEKILEAP